MLRFGQTWFQIVPCNATSHKMNKLPYLRCKRLLLFRGQRLFINPMGRSIVYMADDLWSHRSSRHLYIADIANYYFYDLWYWKEQLHINFVNIGAFSNVYPCTRVLKSLLTPDPFWLLSRKRNPLQNSILLTFLFSMVSGTIWYTGCPKKSVLIILGIIQNSIT